MTDSQDDLWKQYLKDLRRFLSPIVTGALASCIDAHGPITKGLIPSARKRIVTQIASRLKSQRHDDDLAAMHQTKSALAGSRPDTLTPVARAKGDRNADHAGRR